MNCLYKNDISLACGLVTSLGKQYPSNQNTRKSFQAAHGTVFMEGHTYCVLVQGFRWYFHQCGQLILNILQANTYEQEKKTSSNLVFRFYEQSLTTTFPCEKKRLNQVAVEHFMHALISIYLAAILRDRGDCLKKYIDYFLNHIVSSNLESNSGSSETGANWTFKNGFDVAIDATKGNFAKHFKYNVGY